MSPERGSQENLAERALLAHVRHEIRTPINAILGYAEMLLEDDPPEQGVADLERIQRAGRELLALVERLLGAPQGGSGLDWDALGAEIRHAMRTPIDSVIGYCEILREDLPEAPEGFAADLLRIETAARRLLSLIEDLVSLARQAPGEPSRAAAGIEAAVSGVVHDLRDRREAGAEARPQGGRILIADDNPVDRDLLSRRLSREGYEVQEAEDGLQALEQVRATPPDLLLLDVLMPGLNGFQVLDQLKSDRRLRAIPVVMLSSWDEADSVARCLAAGAEDYLPKPVNPTVLLARIAGCIDRKRKRDLEASHLRQLEEEKDRGYGELVGKHPSISELRKQIAKLADADAAVLIQGGRGTGKELVGRLIHRQGRRAEAPFLSVEGAGLADSPWGDKLFGETAGAGTTTGGKEATYLELVDGGTILLKHIEHLPPALQDRLARYLGGGPLPGQRRPDARIIATCGGELAALTEAGQIHPELAASLSAHVLTAPALRDRKRDVPELAAYFLRRAASRLNKKVEGFEDAAATRLVTYDYPFANVRELEQAVERAVSLTPHATIGAEEVFLGPPPSSGTGGFNLLQLPASWVRLGLRLFPGPARLLTAAIFALILAACLLPALKGLGQLGTLLVWSVWWPMLMVLFILAGRAWCAICPMALAGEAAQRLRKAGPARRIPAWMKEHDVAIPMAGFFLILWAEAVSGMRHSPLATGLLLLSILAGALVVGVLYPRRAWCRHLCPLGGFGGACSTTALLELRPTPDICTAKCKGHDCYTGRAQGADGCPMFQHLMFVDSNRDCVLCMNCVVNCPNGSPRLNLRWPARELWSGIQKPGFGTFVLLLLGLLAAETLLRRLEAPGGMLVGVGGWARAGAVTLAMVAAAGLALAVAWLVDRAATRDPARAIWGRVMALAPLMTAGFFAYQIGFVPALGSVKFTLGYHPPQAAGFDLPPVGALAAAQFLILAAGLAITALALWKLPGGGTSAEPARAE